MYPSGEVKAARIIQTGDALIKVVSIDNFLGITMAIAQRTLKRQAISQLATTLTAPVAPVIDVNELFATHRKHLLYFVQRYVRSLEDAEDVVQNTFIEAMRCADRFSGLSKPSTWLFGIALNVARNQVRRNCADPIDDVDETLLEQMTDSSADPANLIEWRQLAGKVQMLLETMPDDIRATFEAVMSDGLSYEEAAEQLCIPIGTVRSRISRVRASVRAEYS
jgi:RNA polymerase sigma factor (sigma-70 family)